MAQASFLDSTKENGKFSVGVELVISLGSYETLHIGLDLANEKPENASIK